MCGYALYRFAPHSLGWFVPLLAGLALSMPLVWISSSPKLGMLLVRDNLFLTPSETGVIPVLKRAHQLLERREAEAKISDYRELVLNDPAVRDLHLRLLEEVPPPPAEPSPQMPLLVEAARRGDTRSFTRQDWVMLLSNSQGVGDASREAASS
jgi:membrane glycosyltransferase